MMSRAGNRRLAVCVTLLLAACSRRPANPEVNAAVAAFDQQLEQIDQWRAKLGVGAVSGAGTEQDFRGLTLADDFKRWVLPPDTRREIKALRDRALAAEYPADAKLLLAQAGRRADDDVALGVMIGSYWNAHLPAPYWRRYWHDLYAANGVSEEAPDSMLVSIEGRMARSLGSGDFKTAAAEAEELDATFGESLSRAADRIYHSREPALVFTPRKTPCPTGHARPSGEKARLVRGESVDAFYPADAIKLGARGTVVLRAQIDAAGCARAVMIQVHSGVPSLDAAALNWFETARFTPASARGAPIDSMLVWKVRFELRESAG
jgi:TonB family protein